MVLAVVLKGSHTMRWILIALLMSAGAAHAQTAAVARPHAHHTFAERFDEANTTHDGHLTAEQARSKMPSVARDFAAIDATHKGYVTIDDIKAYRHDRRLARRAAKQGTETPDDRGLARRAAKQGTETPGVPLPAAQVQ